MYIIKFLYNHHMQTKWDLSTFYKSPGDPQIEIDKKIILEKAKEFAKKWQGRVDYLSDPVLLKQALDDYEVFIRNYDNGGKVYFYFYLSNVLNQLDNNIRAKLNLATDFVLEVENNIRFFELSLKDVKITNVPGYEHFLERIIAERKHVLSEPEEKIISLKSQSGYQSWVDMTEKFLSRDNISLLQSQMADVNKKTRDTAAVKFNEIMEKYSDVAEHELNAVLQNKKVDDQLRKFPRPDSSRHLGDDMETETIDQLVKVVTDNFAVAHEFYKLKAKLLGVKKLKYHERLVPVGAKDRTYKLEEMVSLCGDVFASLDPEFKAIFDAFLNDGKVDLLPQKGKTGGAACIDVVKSCPTFIFQNFTGKIRDITTLAHEMGHGINSELYRKTQNGLNFGVPMSTAEVASTFMEDFVLERLIREADEKTRLSLFVSKLDHDISTIFRQVALYNFEKELHAEFRAKGYLPKEEIGKLFQKHMAVYMGPAVEQSPGSENWWVYWSHIRYYFYVYSYAGGLLISKNLQKQVRVNPKFIANVKQFLSAGLSDSPKNIFAKLGINISDANFWQSGIDEVKSLLEETKNLYSNQ